MLEILVGVAAIVAMVRIASAENLSTIIWGATTFALCFACIALIPWPLIRVGIGFGLSFAAMTAYKIYANR